MKPAAHPTYHLNIGEIIVCPEPSIISTVLGSCISVCLFSEKTGIGGMIHYAHPRLVSRYGQAEDFRYGEIAIPALVEEMEIATGEPASQFVAKIVGGASEIDGGKSSHDIGQENAQLALQILQRLSIPIVGEDTGGNCGRKVLFHTSINRLQVSLLRPKNSGAILVHSKVTSAKKGLFDKVSTPFTPAKKRKVLIVDDSKVIRDLLKRILSEDADFEIIGFAADAKEAASIVKKTKPDVITLDIHMPGMTGVEWLERLLPLNPIPVVMISSLQLQEGNEVFRALELGAIDYIQKPSLKELLIAGPLIREKVKAASFAKVMRSTQKQRPALVSLGEIDMRKVLAIGASTGGTEALKVVMASLPDKIPATVIVQHIPPVFSKAFADRLNDLCPFEVKEAEDGDELRPCRVLIAPGGKQMKIQRTTNGLCVRINDDAPMNRHRPSVDYLLYSVASVVGKNSVGVILTGMGGDGAQGLLAMLKTGAKTMAQDEESCVVYGMPKVAFDIGAAEKVVPLEGIAKEILSALAIRKAA